MTVQTDSQLLALQVSGRYKIRAAHLGVLLEQVRSLMREFESVEITHTLRDGNVRADRLANQGARANSLRS